MDSIRDAVVSVAMLLLFIPPPCEPPKPTLAVAVAEKVVWGEVQWSEKIACDVGGEHQHRTPDGSRVDVLTETHAWEVEWADKWEQAIGQAVFYALATDRKPGVWLLLKTGDEADYLRCLAVCTRLGIVLKTTKAVQP